MANKSDKRIATENAATRRLLVYGTVTTQCLQLFLFFFFKSQRTQGHITLYLLTTVPSAFLTFQLYSMAASRYSATGALISAGDDLSQPGLTQYMMDIVFVTWAAQVLACVWTRAWWIYASIPAFAAYKIFNIASPYIFRTLGSAKESIQKPNGATATANKEGLSRRQQKMQAKYEKGDKRVQMGQR